LRRDDVDGPADGVTLRLLGHPFVSAVRPEYVEPRAVL
jgi:hypothetical protein